MHVLVFLCLAFLFGCFCGIKFATINIIFVLCGIGSVFAVKLLIFKKKTAENLCVTALIFVFCCGVGLGINHDYKTFSKISALYGTDITVSGRITEKKDENFAVDTEYGRLWVYNYILAEVEKGDNVTVRGNLDCYETAQYNGGFDARLHNALYGIVGNITCTEVKITGHEDKYSLWDLGTYVREKIERNVMSLQISSECKGFVTALLTGSTDMLDDSVNEAFKITGISHLTAVSGLHVGIFMSFFILFSKGIRKNRIAHLFMMVILVVMYTVLIGERASVFRAGIMVIVSYIMFTVRRRSDSTVNLMIAGVMICLINPYYVTAPGFQMSFIATLGLVIFGEYFKYPAISVPVIATTFMLPVTLYYYNSVSLTTVFANMCSVFLVPLVIIMGYIGCLVPFSMYISCAVAELIILIAKFFASFEYLHFTLPSPDIRQFAMWFLLIIGAYFGVCKRQVGRMMIMILGVLVIFIGGLVAGNEEKSASVKFMNIGNYNMEHITTENGYEIFVDCGFNATDYAVKNGIGEIYAVLITDSNEARRSGLGKLCSEQRVRYVILPAKLAGDNLNLENCEILYYNQDDYEFSVDGVIFKFTKRNNGRCLLIQLYNDIMAMPFNKTVSDVGSCTVMCVPDNCSDCASAAESDLAEYYIHPTYRYAYYDYGNKYITKQVGMVNMVFRNNAKPIIHTY